MKQAIRPSRGPGAGHDAFGLDLLDSLERRANQLLDLELHAVGRGDFSEAKRLNSLRQELAERRHAELLRCVGSSGPPAAAPGLGMSA